MHFIFDIDGTICFNGRTISPAIQDALDSLRQHGHQLGFASARPYRDILPLLDARFHDALIIGANGAMSHRQGQLHRLTPIRTRCSPTSPSWRNASPRPTWWT